jgi:hypothetical protein
MKKALMLAVVLVLVAVSGWATEKPKTFSDYCPRCEIYHIGNTEGMVCQCEGTNLSFWPTINEPSANTGVPITFKGKKEDINKLFNGGRRQ